jgi:hypothetical protein
MDAHEHINAAEKTLENASGMPADVRERMYQLAQTHALIAIAQSLRESAYGDGLADTIRRVGEMR